MPGAEDFLSQSAEWIIGGGLVLIYARGRFRTPKTNVGTTTYYRFLLAAWSYYTAAFLLFFFLSKVLADTPEFAMALGLSGDTMGEGLEGLSSPLMAALLMTVMLPNVRMLSRVDEWLLRTFRDIGNIPWEIRKWRDQLVSNEPVIPPQARTEMLRMMEQDPRMLPFKAEHLAFTPGDTPSYQLTKVIYLMQVLEDLSTRDHSAYARVLDEFSEDYLAIKAQFEQALVAAARCLEVTAKVGEGDAATIQAVTECKRAFRERCDTLYKDMCLLLGRAVLYKERTQSGRVAKLKALGFMVHEDEGAPSPLDANQILLLSSIVALILGLGAVGIGMRGTPQEVTFRIIMIAAIFGAAVLCALWPKSWPIADPSRSRSRPVAGYLLSGMLAVGCAALISVLFKSVALGSTIAALDDVQTSYPWFLLSCATASGLAALSDNWGGDNTRAPVWGRYAEGAALAGVLSAAFFLVRSMLDAIEGRAAPDVRTVLVSAAIGFALGVLVPHWYRRHRHAQGQAKDGNAPLTPVRSMK